MDWAYISHLHNNFPCAGLAALGLGWPWPPPSHSHSHNNIAYANNNIPGQGPAKARAQKNHQWERAKRTTLNGGQCLYMEIANGSERSERP